jgi:putative phosphoesterase
LTFPENEEVNYLTSLIQSRTEFVVISDVHSNYLALEKVLKDIDKQGYKDIFCLGDLTGYGPFPNKVFPLLTKFRVKTLMGNYDEAVGFDLEDCGCQYSGLPKSFELEVGGFRLKMVHGSPKSMYEFIYKDSPPQRVLDLMEGQRIDVLFCGHTHLPYIKKIRSKWIVNPGSVGRPRSKSPSSSFAIVELDGELKAEITKVDYHYEKHAREIEESHLPNDFAEHVRKGCY